MKYLEEKDSNRVPSLQTLHNFSEFYEDYVKLGADTDPDFSNETENQHQDFFYCVRMTNLYHS